ncbi:hypothetical protein [Acidisphaera sp. S103]|uniref:hypothetical protein n=1 Tax=Acidisphaera sp. S103 TaxID=1747223 RepID=UPI00131C0280|nr:hypothetical protein [Acidisphaera sp. S103]
MAQNIFHAGLNDFSRKYFITGQPVSAEDIAKFQERLNEQKMAIFEQLMLFDRITFKVWGESVVIPILMRAILGERSFDALIEQGAIHFVLWRPTVVYLQKNIPGVNALAHGNLSTPAHSDPKASIDLGLKFLNPPLDAKKAKKLAKKLLRLYTLPDKKLPEQAVRGVNDAAQCGLLDGYGIKNRKLDEFSLAEKVTLSRCAEDFLEYQYLTQQGMTSFSEYKFFSPFWESIERFRTVRDIGKGFGELSKIENVPNLRELFRQLPDPLGQLPKLRSTSNAVKFREWLETTAGESASPDFPKEYINSVTERKGLFETAPGKFAKAVAMASIGGSIGAFMGGPAAAAVGGGLAAAVSVAAERLPEITAELGLHLIDSFLLDRWLHGWSPRMFFNEVERVIGKGEA